MAGAGNETPSGAEAIAPYVPGQCLRSECETYSSYAGAMALLTLFVMSHQIAYGPSRHSCRASPGAKGQDTYSTLVDDTVGSTPNSSATDFFVTSYRPGTSQRALRWIGRTLLRQIDTYHMLR